MPKVSAFFFILFISMCSGCMSTRLVAFYDSDNIQPFQTTKVNYLWGLVQPNDIPAKCESNSICKVTTKTNLGFVLISAVTAGIVVPQTVIWECCPVIEPEEVLE